MKHLSDEGPPEVSKSLALTGTIFPSEPAAGPSIDTQTRIFHFQVDPRTPALRGSVGQWLRGSRRFEEIGEKDAKFYCRNRLVIGTLKDRGHASSGAFYANM